MLHRSMLVNQNTSTWFLFLPESSHPHYGAPACSGLLKRKENHKRFCYSRGPGSVNTYRILMRSSSLIIVPGFPVLLPCRRESQSSGWFCHLRMFITTGKKGALRYLPPEIRLMPCPPAKDGSRPLYRRAGRRYLFLYSSQLGETVAIIDVS